MKLLRNESGFALPLALLVMVTTSAILVTAIKTTSSSGRTANLGKTAISAEALAEAGINNAMAVLANPSNYALNSQLLPSHTTTYNEGTVTWSGTLDPLTGYWTITSVGSVQNPTGPGFRTRRLTATTQVVPTLSQPLNTLAWNYIYSRQTGNTCDMTIGQTVSIASPLYVNGNLCLQNQAKVAKGPLVVGGSLTQTNQNSVGTGSTPVNSVVVGGTCSKGNTTQNPCLGTSAVNIFATTFTRTVPSIPAPNVDLDGWYLVANPGPYYPCTTSSGTPPVFDTGQGPLPGSAVYRNNSLNSGTPFNLTPGSSYSCKTVAGELSWNAATNVLTIKGTVFIDGSAEIQNGNINSYSGFGTIYLSGTLLVKNSSMCAVKTANGSTCTASGWSSNSTMLVFVANGNGGMGGAAAQVGASNGVEVVSGYLQGAVYATSAIDIATTSQVDGPLDGSTVRVGQSTSSSWPVFTIVPAGMPGNPVVYAEPQRPSYSG
jgi:hypothetical protein